MKSHETMDSASSTLPKLITAWTGFGTAEWLSRLGVHGWSDAAGMAATVYSLFLIGDWLLKKYRWWCYRRLIARADSARRGN